MDTDPYSWTVSEVQDFFRNHATNTLDSRPNSQLPPLQPFLEALSENAVDGATLLENVDNASLRDDLGVHKLGVRGTILYCINKLKSTSVVYNIDINAAAVAPLVSARGTFNRESSDLSFHEALSSPTANEDLPVTAGRTLQYLDNGIDEKNNGSWERKPSPGEDKAIDATGRRRRRIQPVLVNPAPSVERSTGIHDPSRELSGKQREDAAISLDKLFFEDTALGRELFRNSSSKKIGARDSALDIDPDSDNYLNFQFSEIRATPWHSAFIYDRVKHLLANRNEVEIERQDRSAIAVLPYREHRKRGREPLNPGGCSTIVYQYNDSHNDPRAIRELKRYLHTGNPYDLVDRAEHDDVNYEEVLADWEGVEQRHGSPTVVTVFDDTDVDEGSSLTSDGENEDMEEVEVNSRVIPSHRVSDLIDSRISEFVANWKTKLPDLEKKTAWTVWKKTKQRHSIREALIIGANSFIAAMDRRLATMKEELTNMDWESENTILRCCESLQPTVEEREHRRWMIDVWMRKQAPEHISRHSHNKPRPSSHVPFRTDRKMDDDDDFEDDRFDISHALDVQAGETNVQRSSLQDVTMSESVEYQDRELSYEGDHEDSHISDEESALPVASVIDDQKTMANDFKFQTPSFDADIETYRRVPSSTAGRSSQNQPRSPESDRGSLPTMEEFASSDRQPHRSVNNAVIDLTYSSDTQMQTPSRKERRMPATPQESKHQGDPRQATVAEVDSWDLYALAEANDKQRLLIKLLSALGADNRALMHKYVKSAGQQRVRMDLHNLIKDIHDGITPETSTEDDVSRFYCTRVWLAWIVSTRTILNWTLKLPIETAIPALRDAEWSTALNPSQIGLFVPMLNLYLQSRQSKLFIEPPRTDHSSPSKALLIESSDEEPQTPQKKRTAEDSYNTPHKKRKRAVQKDVSAARSRKIALDRQERYDAVVDAQTSDLPQLAALIEHTNEDVQVEINPARREGEDPIYISSEIARNMKPHQIEGIRFLWRETATADSDEADQGCILAHTMGLGKTMQTLALLVALDVAARSQNPRVSSQLSQNLRIDDLPSGRTLRMLILCPPALIQNWRAEIEHWVPKNLWYVFSYESGKLTNTPELERWVRDGGILLLGYQMFRASVTRKGDKNGEIKRKNRSDEEIAFLEDALLHQPDVVVADEAHTLKNSRSAIGVAAGRFRCSTRIALTGTPMSNDVQEIYSLVSWVAPGYLGDPVEFRAHFAEPIQEGLYFESTHTEKRKSIKKLKVLHHTIGPKVNRATIEALRGSLKPKVEFVITIPLTSCQMELYKRYVQVILRDSDGYIASLTRVFGWLAVLTLLTNHPYCFREKLLAPPRNSSQLKPTLHNSGTTLLESSNIGDMSSGTTTPINCESIAPLESATDYDLGKEFEGDQNIGSLGFTPEMVDEILGDMRDGIDFNPELSAKVTILITLLELCLQCKDKVLVFSTSIPTLNYLDKLFHEKNLPFGCIKGSTPIRDRPQILEDFHNDKFEIILISTRAGGVGLNIQGANRVFILDFSFNPTWEEQAIGRAYRIGQTKPVYVYRFVAGGTFEKNIYNTQIFKSSLAQRVVDKKNPRRSAERKHREWLYEPSEPTQEDISEWIGKDKMVLDQLIMQHGPGEEGKIDSLIRGIKTMETLQEEAQDPPLDIEEQAEVDQEIAEGRGRKIRKSTNTS